MRGIGERALLAASCTLLPAACLPASCPPPALPNWLGARMCTVGAPATHAAPAPTPPPTPYLSARLDSRIYSFAPELVQERVATAEDDGTLAYKLDAQLGLTLVQGTGEGAGCGGGPAGEGWALVTRACGWAALARGSTSPRRPACSVHGGPGGAHQLWRRECGGNRGAAGGGGRAGAPSGGRGHLLCAGARWRAAPLARALACGVQGCRRSPASSLPADRRPPPACFRVACLQKKRRRSATAAPPPEQVQPSPKLSQQSLQPPPSPSTVEDQSPEPSMQRGPSFSSPSRSQQLTPAVSATSSPERPLARTPSATHSPAPSPSPSATPERILSTGDRYRYRSSFRYVQPPKPSPTPSPQRSRSRSMQRSPSATTPAPPADRNVQRPPL